MTIGKSKHRRTRGRPSTGKAVTAAERMRRLRERRKAAGLKPIVSWVPRTTEPLAAHSSHRLLEARSLAMHALIAAKIDRTPGLISIAHRNLERWSARWSDRPPAWLAQWSRILKRPWPEIAAIITAPQRDIGAAEAVFALCRGTDTRRAGPHL